MSSSKPAPTAPRSTRIQWFLLVALAVAVAVVVAVTLGVLGDQPSAALTSAASPSSVTPDAPARSEPAREATPPTDDPRPDQAQAPVDSPRNDDRGVLGADGDVADGVTVFDDEVPAVAKLDPDLLDAVRQAATDAADDGVEFSVTSGWRSPEYQDQLLREAIAEYGSAEEAARWVATPDASSHVQGDAIDIGQWDAMAWLSEHGAEYGLCQIYANESWHYELRPDAIDGGCPAMYADASHDPRMHQ